MDWINSRVFKFEWKARSVQIYLGPWAVGSDLKFKFAVLLLIKASLTLQNVGAVYRSPLKLPHVQ